MRPIVAFCFVLLVSALLVACSDANAQSPWSSWRTLRMEAHAIPMFNGDMVMRRAEEDGKSILTTQTTARFLGARVASSETRTVIDPSSGRTESYVMTSHSRGRRYAFGERGYSVEKLKPTQGADAPLDQWEVTTVREFDYPRREDGRVEPVFDFYGMLLHLGRLPLEAPGDEATLFVATSSGPVPYRIVVSEVQATEQEYEDLATKQKHTLPVREFRLRIIPADPENADEGFMKMEGETELWVEAGSKTLLRLSGTVRRVPGRVRLELTGLG